ncbi:MAG: YihY/virulence factor BrkB family protein [Longimicrobiales bacterium]
MTAEPATAAAPRPRRRSRLAEARERSVHFLRLVYEKAGSDNIFFMAGAIAFNVLIAIPPLLLAIIGIAGTILSVQAYDPSTVLQGYLGELLPVIRDEQGENPILNWFRTLIDDAPQLLGIGTIIFIWFATRLVGTLRTTLREVFDINRDRGIIAGKIFDLQMVVVAGILFSINVLLTIMLETAARQGFDLMRLLPWLGQREMSIVSYLWARALAFLFLWVTFLLIYRYLPSRRPGWRTSLLAATAAALFTELLKEIFTYYVTSLATYDQTYPNLVNIAVFVLWIYYTSVVFILGGEIAQVAAMQRVRRRQKERLE